MAAFKALLFSTSGLAVWKAWLKCAIRLCFYIWTGFPFLNELSGNRIAIFKFALSASSTHHQACHLKTCYFCPNTVSDRFAWYIKRLCLYSSAGFPYQPSDSIRLPSMTLTICSNVFPISVLSLLLHLNGLAILNVLSIILCTYVCTGRSLPFVISASTLNRLGFIQWHFKCVLFVPLTGMALILSVLSAGTGLPY